jgi:four helix bundle protein
MARDHRKLQVFQQAHQITRSIYLHTKNFPRDEWFGLRAQMRRAAVSIGSNIVEGCARLSVMDYRRFLGIARGSAGELLYLVELSYDLEYLDANSLALLKPRCERLTASLEALVRKVGLLSEEATAKEAPEKGREPKT